MSTTTLDAITRHILAQVPKHPSPLFVALQGPQGSGKTWVSRQIQTLLGGPEHNLRIAVLSIDDLYHPYDELCALALTGNPLLNGRGQPGTHDLKLGSAIIKKLKNINEEGAEPVRMPIYDKSLHDGWGDRAVDKISMVHGPLDVVILEGWCVGFHPVSSEVLHQKWNIEWPVEAKRLGIVDRGSLATVEEKHVTELNKALSRYLQLWDYFDVFVQLAPYVADDGKASYCGNIYRWRLQQEHTMKASNGGRGMTDEMVERFVDRYIPGYVFFREGIHHGSGDVKPRWISHSLRVFIDEDRNLRKQCPF